MKIVITGAGSAQSNGVINCLLKDSEENEIIGFGADPYDLMFCKAHQKYLVPHSSSDGYKKKFLNLLRKIRPDMIHFQHDRELYTAINFRDEIESLGIKMLIPDNETINICIDKYKSWEKFKQAGLTVPENMYINNEKDLHIAFETLRNSEGKIWLRSTNIGGGGLGSLAASNFKEASEWITRNNGWGSFIAAEVLSKETVTWLSVWYRGELIVAQGRKRHGWAHSALSPSGVTGVTKVGETFSSEIVDQIGERSCRAVSVVPHGVYGVDMTYDFCGIPNPTEINIGRFFTTVQFFAEAGLNMPVILKNLCLYNGRKPDVKKYNPLPDGLLWLRAMDCLPILATEADIKRQVENLEGELS